MTGLSYRPELDGLRSVAVYLVLLFHAGMAGVDGGFIGVDLFFVLSGFLVTGVILREVNERGGTFSLGDFYSRRVRRLLPAALVVIAATAVLQVLVASLPARIDMIDDARASLLYFANWHFVLESRDYFAQTEGASPYLHFWSLSIEEQFYIGYPLLVLLVLRVSHKPMRLLGAALVAIVVLSTLLQVVHAAFDETYAYYATETRIYQLAAGALLAVGVHSFARYGESPAVRALATPVAATGLLGLLLVATPAVDASASVRGLLAAALACALVAGLWWSPRGWLSRLLALPVPRYLGQISYGTYLWHWPVLLVLRDVFDAEPAVFAVLGAVLSTALAALSFTVLERPVRRSPLLAGRRWAPVVGGLAVSVAAAAMVVPHVMETDTRPALSVAAATDSAALTADLERLVPSDLDLVEAANDVGPTPPRCTPEEPDACTLVEGEGRHVLLIGDSQARMYVPALEELAREHDLTLSADVKGGCPWQLGQVNLKGGDAGMSCHTARKTFFDEVLPDMDVDVVLAVGLSRSDDYWDSRLGGVDGPTDESLPQLLVRTTRESAEAITAAGPELVIARSMFGTDGFGLDGFDPIECLASAERLADCGVVPPMHRPTVDAAYGVLATEMSGVHAVDLNPVICPDRPVCKPVLGDTVVWKDPDHVTTRVLVERREEIWDVLTGTGLLD